MNEHHAPKDDAWLHQMSSAVPAATPMPVLKATTTTTGNLVSANAHHSHAAAAARVAAAAQAAAQSMAYDPAPKTSDEGRPYHPVRKESDQADNRKKSGERKGSAKKNVDDDDDEEVPKSGIWRRDSYVKPVDPDDVMKFLQKQQDERRPIAHIGTVLDERDRLPERRLKSYPPPDTKDLYVDNERIKLNRSYKLRYNFLRKQGSVPSSMQDHMQRFKKPPFKRVWKPGWCIDNISDRLAKLSGKERKP